MNEEGREEHFRIDQELNKKRKHKLTGFTCQIEHKTKEMLAHKSREGCGWGDWDWHTHTAMCKIDNE